MILAVTGHRPDKLGGWKIPNPTFDAVVERIDKTLMDLRPEVVITGMSLGVDQWVAELCVENDIPFIAAVPFEGQESIWPDYSKARYYQLLQHASKIMNLAPGGFEKWKMHARNKWMVKNSELLLAVWDGSRGGTGSCISSAIEMGRKIIYLKLPDNIPAPPLKQSKQLQFQMGAGNGNWDSMVNPCVEIPLLQAFGVGDPPPQAPKPQQWMKVTAITPKPLFKKDGTPAVPVQTAREEKQEEKSPYQRFVDLSD